MCTTIYWKIRSNVTDVNGACWIKVDIYIAAT